MWLFVIVFKVVVIFSVDSEMSQTWFQGSKKKKKMKTTIPSGLGEEPAEASLYLVKQTMDAKCGSPNDGIFSVREHVSSALARQMLYNKTSL